MRTCMYCGRELEKDEKCTCPQSKARRGETDSGAGEEKEPEQKKEQKKQKKEQKKEQKKQKANPNYSDPYRTNTSYRTGYAGGDSGFGGVNEQYRAKRAAKNRVSGGFWNNIWQYIVRSIRTPVEAVTNPTQLGKGAMLSIAAVMGALLWLCVFFILRGGAVGPFRLIASAMGFGGGYTLILSILAAIVSGAVGGVVMFFLYTGIFYLINKFIMHMRTPYWDFCVRLVSAWVPFTVICLIGTALSLFSPYTLIALVLCGAAVTAVLTYEALKTEWCAFPPSRIVYSMLLGYFVFLSVMAHLLLI